MSDASVLQARLIGALFVERGLLTDEQLERALARQAESGELLGEILVNEFDISRIELASVLAEQWAALEQQETDAPSETDVSGSGNGSAAARRRIGEIFVERGFVSEEELGEALEAQKASGQPLGEVLIERGSLSRLDLAGALAEQWAGLEKLRPPSPKRVEGWQQVAPVELVAAAAQGAARASEREREPEPETETAVEQLGPELGETIAALAERLSVVEAQGGANAALDELRGSLDALTVQIDGLAAGEDGKEQKAADELAALRSGLDGISARLDSVEQRKGEHPWRDELEHVAAGLAMRVDGLHVRIDEAASGAASGLEAVLETLSELQEQVVSSSSSTETGVDLAAMEERLAAVVAASGAVDELSRRLEALEHLGTETPWRDEIAVLEHRLAEPATDALEVRLAALEANGAKTPWRDELAALQGRLEKLASSGSVEALLERIAALETGTQERPWRKELRRLSDDVGASLDALGEQSSTGREELEQLRASLNGLGERLQQSNDVPERLAALEGRAAETPWRNDVVALRDRLEELAASAPPMEALFERLGALEAATQERPWRDELQRLSDEVSGRLDEQSTAGATRREELERVRADLTGFAERLQQLSGAWAPADHAHEELAGLQEQVGQLAQLPVTMEGLARRIEAAERRDAETPWREELTGIATRVEALGAALENTATSDGVAALEERLTALRQAAADAEGGTASRLAELGARLDEVARSVADLAATGVAGASGVARSELDHLEVLVNDIRSASREAARAAEAAHLHADDRAREEAAGRDQLGTELRGRLDALASSLSDSIGQVGSTLDELGAELAGVKRETLGREDVEQVLAAGETRLIERLAAYDEAIVVLRRRLEEIAALDGILGERLGSVEAGVVARLDEAAAALAAETASWHESLESLSARVGGVEHHARSTPQALYELDTKLEALLSRVAAVESSVSSATRAGSGWTDAAAALGSRLIAVEETLAAPAEDSVTPRLGELERRIEIETTQAGERARAAEKALRKGLGAFTERLAAVEETLAAPVEDRFTPRLEELEQRLAAEAARAADRLRAAESAVRDDVAGVVSRLDAVEETLAAPVEDPVTPRLEELERKVDREVSQSDERTRATESALRDGLAILATRLADSESAYTQAGEGLRRSIERLGRAIVQADEQIAARDGETQSQATDAYVAFAPSPEGYRLVAIDGRAPGMGETVELAGHDEPLRVTRVGASPIPLDDRVCVYLDRA